MKRPAVSTLGSLLSVTASPSCDPRAWHAIRGTFSDADLVITAANGDELYGTYAGVMTGETTYVETMVITGGTGRSAGASGTVDESGWFDPDTGYMEVTGRGTITYDASDRSSME